MGCHTWFYRRIDRTIEEARELFLTEYKKSLKSWEELLNNPADECRVAYGWTQEYCDHYFEVLKRQIRMVEKGLCNVAVMNKQLDHCIYIPGRGLFITDVSMTHNIFRIGGYPEDMLFSFEETIEFIEKNKEAISNYRGPLQEDTIDRLKKFWEQYPDGMIDFG